MSEQVADPSVEHVSDPVVEPEPVVDSQTEGAAGIEEPATEEKDQQPEGGAAEEEIVQPEPAVTGLAEGAPATAEGEPTNKRKLDENGGHIEEPENKRMNVDQVCCVPRENSGLRSWFDQLYARHD
jgi:hypothetical protein